MSQIIDRRLYDRKHKGAANRERFMRRYRQQIKKAVADAISKRSMREIDKGETIAIPSKDISEPQFRHGQGGKHEFILTGNKEFVKGDQIKRPSSSQGQGGGAASDQGEGHDDFVFEISRKEFIDLFFDDLELPDLVKKQMGEAPNYKYVRAGYSTAGVPTNMNIVRSFLGAYARRIALKGPHKKRIKELEEELKAAIAAQDKEAIKKIQDEILELEGRIKRIPFIDTFDIRYNYHVKQPQPSTKAVMFCVMDVSGSMDEAKKEIAKRFFILLYLFLTKKYEQIELVFIRHHTTAKVVEEEEFFYSRETGGTVVSSALELMRDLINEKYSPREWNIYAAQASDGDNWNADSPYCRDLLLKEILPKTQFFAYVEISPRHHQSLWESYEDVLSQSDRFSMQTITNLSEIYPVFREFFKKHTVSK